MNRFGIRLAAGLAVVCLGSLAIFQAQQDKNSQLGDAWPSAADVAATEPPVPLGVSSDWPALPDESQPTVVRGNDFGTAANGPLGNDPAPSSEYPAQIDQAAYAMPQYDSQPNTNESAAYQPPNTMANPGGVSLASFDQPAGNGFDEPTSDPTAGPSSANGFAAPGFAQPPAIDIPASLNSAATASDAQPQTGQIPDIQPSGDAAYAPAFNSPQPGSDATNYNASDYPAPNTEMRLSPLSTTDFDQPQTPNSGVPNAGEVSANEMAAVETPPGNENPASFYSGGNTQLAPLPTDNTALTPGLDTPPVGSGYAPTDGPQSASSQPPLDALDATAAQWQQPSTPAPLNNPNLASPSVPNAFSQGSSPVGSGLAPLPTSSGEAPRIASNPAGSSGLRSGSLSGSSYSPVLSQLQTIDAGEVLAEPGTRDLEGAQTPSVLVQKRAPSEIRVGKPAEFVINVKNVGTVPALDVRVFDTVPVGTRLDSSVPPAEKVQDLMVWQLGDLGPGEERALTVRLVPEVEGEIGSVARVTFEAAASVRTIATQPNVQFVHRAPEQVLIGQQIEIDVEIKNTGSGTADNVMVLAELPEGLESPNGRSLKLPIGSMAPGAMHRDVLRLRATKPGMLIGQFAVNDSDGVIANVEMNVQVISPKLDVALQGPSMRYLERQATYNVQVANNGSADASDIDLIVYLDRGLKFVSTEYQGKYDPNRHAVFWALEELRANEVGEVPLTLLPVEPGVQKVRVETTGALGVSAKSERELTIETLAELTFSIADDQDPIEPGAFTTYEVRVKNTGSRDDTNVILEVQIPYPGLELVTAEPSAGTDGKGKVIFEPIARIPAKGEQVYRIRVKGVQPDTHVMRATIVSAQSKRAVTKEESTTVYQDR